MMWLLETEVLARSNHPLMTVFSSRLLEEPQAVSGQLRQEGLEPLVVYVVQQIAHFRLQGETFAMQHLGSTEELERMYEALLSSLPEEKVKMLLRKLSPADRLEGLSPEQVVGGLSAEERERVLRLLQEQQMKKPKRGKKA
jgi:hypothetical protein